MGRVKGAPFIGAAFLLCACMTDIKERVVTTDNARTVWHDLRNSTELSDDQKASFARALDRADYQPYGKTVAQILKDQRMPSPSPSPITAASSIPSQSTQGLNRDIDVKLTRITVTHGTLQTGGTANDEPAKDIAHFSFVIRNLGTRPIRTFKADVLVFNAVAGQPLYAGTLFGSGPLAAHAAQTISVNEGPNMLTDDARRIRATAATKATVRYAVTHIWYADGTDRQMAVTLR